jgi:hypothetical protein
MTNNPGFLAWISWAEGFLISEWPWLLAILALCLAFIAAEIWISRK